MSSSSRSPRSSKSAAARRARVEEMQRKQRAADRRRRLMVASVVGAAALVIVVVIVIVVVTRSGGSSTAGQQIVPKAPTGSETTEQAPTSVPDKSGISGVLAWDTTGYPGNGQSPPGAVTNDHVTGPVKYAVLPPVGGPHNAIWMNAGVYTEPIPSELALHNLEHGAVWIVYDPTLPARQVAQLTAFVDRQTLIAESVTGATNQANRYIDMSPWGGAKLPTPIVISAWGHQLRLKSPSDPRLQQFVDTFRNNTTYSPEFGSAVDGIPVDSGGRAATDGSREPNPTGSVP